MSGCARGVCDVVMVSASQPWFQSVGPTLVPEAGSLEPAFVTLSGERWHDLTGRRAQVEPLLSCTVPELIRCANRGDLDAARSLLEKGADPNCGDDFNLTSLHGAAKKGHQELVELLLRWGARVNARATSLDGETPFFYACKYGRASIAQLLLRSGADPSMGTGDGRTPLGIARQRKHRAIEKLIAEYCATSDLPSQKKDRSWAMVLGDHGFGPRPAGIDAISETFSV